jgi:aminocarboxymuconate-semialdehyde decarboxylase
MPNRRDFIKGVAGATAGLWAANRTFMRDAAAQGRGQGGGQGQAGASDAPVMHRDIRVGGKRVKVIDVHAHATIPEVADVVKGTPLERYAQGGRALGPDRIRELDKRGIDIQVLDINTFWWYNAADRDLAAKIVDVHDKGLAAWVNSNHDRFLALTSPTLQFPDLAAQQLEHAVKNLGLVGAAVAGHVQGEPLSDPKYDPFWAKAQELDVMVFMHPNNADNVTKEGLKGRGDLGNIIGNPLETTLFLSHMIYDGAFDRFPNLKICAAHAGGYMPSYLGRTEVACDVRQNAGCMNKKKPSEYLKQQVYIDSMVFSAEGVRHLVAEVGASQVVYGTDIPLVWPDTIDAILGAQIPDADKEAILGGNLTKLLRIKT